MKEEIKRIVALFRDTKDHQNALLVEYEERSRLS
jgi:hypothetical protein